MKKYLITAAVGALLSAGVFFIIGGQTAEGAALLLAACNAVTAAGVFVFCAGLLVFASNHGAFDIFSYGIMFTVSLMFKNPDKEKYKDYFDYTEKKHAKKAKFGYILIVGGVYLFIAAVLTVIYEMTV